ncbi:MAG: DUF3040 domain-containing protein [Actinobacteria bacterium]|nr:DUF3040 domain-containing protein [Actinomycetota bacterium]
MSLCYRERYQLRGIEAALFRSDSHLAAMLDVFGRLYSSQEMPASEQVHSRKNRDRRAVIRIAAAFAAAALALSVMFGAALTMAAPAWGGASGHRLSSPSAPGRAGKPDAQRNPLG